MELSSVLPCKRCAPWQGLLLTASLLTCWLLSTTAQVSIESLPPQVVEGENVLLRVDNLPENLIAFVWYKGLTNMSLGVALYSLIYNVTVTGPVHSGRETLYSNGSLWIQNVTQKDTGFYTLRTISNHGEIVSNTSLHLHVYFSTLTCGRAATSAQLSIESVPTSISKGESALLLAHNLPENLRAIFWYKGAIVFKDLEVARYVIGTNSSVPGPAHSSRETMYSNGSLLLQNVTRNDAGFYTLKTLSTDLKTEIAYVQLQVDTSSCCDPLTPAPLTIDPVPRHAAKGESVLLQVHNLPEDLRMFIWFKSVYTSQIFKIAEYSRAINYVFRGPAHSGREIVYTNGSLLLQDATEKDTGLYTLQMIYRNFKIETAHVQVTVHKPVAQPFIRVTESAVRVQSSVVLTCLSADTGTSIQWLFNNQNLRLTQRMSLSQTKCQLSIDPVRREDAGEYRCEVSNPVSSKTSLPVSLDVIIE
ncbi:pregnancy-specific glycoprotein 22 isoform X2 [Rattus rattus]|uniref:pregnancy-specific glycoprotein 22 isoform X2 n=1 Tax=Rattus rattus TaxID=10117 RepID=UPI0013F33051|nr:pregnancy-specific glycoprotein 22 isoform X2 [Rattus rattus]